MLEPLIRDRLAGVDVQMLDVAPVVFVSIDDDALAIGIDVDAVAIFGMPFRRWTRAAQTRPPEFLAVLQIERGSLDAQSGMAQTYMRMGNTNEARRLLTQVVEANPKRLNDILILGEMEMREGNLQQAISMLQRAEAQAPSAHAELLTAVAYMKLKQPEKAKHYLDMARGRAPRNPEVYRAIANFFRELDALRR